MGANDTTQGKYDGYAECVRTLFDPEVVSIAQLMGYFFEIIDPYSLNKQGPDEGENTVPGSIVGSNLTCLRQAGL